MQDPNEKKLLSKKKVSIKNEITQVENKSHSESSAGNISEECTDVENEVQVVDLQSESQQPLLILFPELRQEGIDMQKLNNKLSTTDMTKMLLGKRAQFGNFKNSQKLMRNVPIMPTILEDDTSFSDTSLPTSTRNVPRERASSRDADSENDE